MTNIDIDELSAILLDADNEGRIEADNLLRALDELRELYERIEKAASSGNEAEIAALPCEGARDAARGLADLWADE